MLLANSGDCIRRKRRHRDNEELFCLGIFGLNELFVTAIDLGFAQYFTPTNGMQLIINGALLTHLQRRDKFVSAWTFTPSLKKNVIRFDLKHRNIPTYRNVDVELVINKHNIFCRGCSRTKPRAQPSFCWDWEGLLNDSNARVSGLK